MKTSICVLVSLAGAAAMALVPEQEEPSRYGRLMSRRWAFGAKYEREDLKPVANPHPDPEPQPRRDHPYDVAVAGGKVYVTLLGSELEPGNEVAVVEGDAVTKRIRVGSGPFRLALHPGGRFLIVTNRFSNYASVIDTTRDEVVSEIALDFYCQGVAFRPDGRVAYVANRYLDQVFVVDLEVGETFRGTMRVLGGLDERVFESTVRPILQKHCGSCHEPTLAWAAHESLLNPVLPPRLHKVAAVHAREIPEAETVRTWLRGAAEGPGVRVGNPRSKPKIVAWSERHLLVGNTGTQDIAIVDPVSLREVGAIYIQNVVNDLQVVRSGGRELLIVSTLGAGFGVARERDPYGGETWDRSNPAAHFSVWRDPATGKTLPLAEQEVLGPYDAVDGTAAIKFRDVQNDVIVIDLGRLEIAPKPAYVLLANRYESHRAWVRYTSDTAESTAGDIQGDLPPDLMRVVGAFPEKMAVVGDRLFVTMQGSNEVQEWRVDGAARDPSDTLVPVAVHRTGMQPIGIAAADGLLYVANFLGGTLSVIDPAKRTSREIVIDPSVVTLPVPATNAERGEIFAHTSLFSSDGDTSCFHCHYFDMGDGRPWGVSQVVGQDADGRLVIGGTMGVPQMRNLFRIQPFFLEGTLSAFEPRSMIMEHCPADDFLAPNPQGDFTSIEAHRPVPGADDVQSSMSARPHSQSTLEERRDEMFRLLSMRHFGKAFVLRDFQRFVGEWQIAEPRLLPNPFDRASPSVERGRKLFFDPQVGCAACHAPPDFTRKDFHAMAPMVTTTVRDGSFTLVGMNRLDAIHGVKRDLEPWDAGRVEEKQAHYAVLQLRGIWDRPPVFLHHGRARTLHEVVASPKHVSLRTFRYEPLLGGVPERPGGREIGCNETYLVTDRSPKLRQLFESGGRIGIDTHGGTSHLTARQIQDLVDFLNSIE